MNKLTLLPPRTCLLPVEPLGRESKHCESLASVYKRIAMENSIAVARLALLLPKCEAINTVRRRESRPLYLANHGGVVSMAIAHGLESLTGVKDLLTHTLHRWNAARTTAPVILADSTRRWCPDCYLDAVEQESPIYDQLLWSINGVHLCPLHMVRLENSCRVCGKDGFNTVLGKEVPGFCPRCYGFLGTRGVRLNLEHDDDTRYLAWVAQSSAQLVERSRSEQDLNRNFGRMVRALAEWHFGGRYSEVAHAVGRTKSLVSEWASGHCFPRWDALCHTSFAFQVPLLDLISGNEQAVAMSTLRSVPLSQMNARAKRRTPTSLSNDDLARFLNEVEQGLHPTVVSIAEAARRLALHVTSLHKRLPDQVAGLAVLLDQRRREKLQHQRNTQDQLLLAALTPIVIEMRRSSTGLTRRSLAAQYARTGLRVPWHLSPTLLRRAHELWHTTEPA